MITLIPRIQYPTPSLFYISGNDKWSINQKLLNDAYNLFEIGKCGKQLRVGRLTFVHSTTIIVVAWCMYKVV